MRVVALISGGKDSCYNMMQCVVEGHEIVALANLRPVDKDELDSYMFQTVGHNAIELYAEAMDLPLYRQDIVGGSLLQNKYYQPLEGDEVEDLYELLKRVKENIEVEAVSVGAILSNYQRVRVENVCCRLGLICLGYLWRRDQEKLLNEMINANIVAVVIKVAALGLNSRHLYKNLSEIKPHMLKMKEKYYLNPCGEGGEYETFTMDCPLFHKKLVIDEYEVVEHDLDPFAPVTFINFKKMHLEDKHLDFSISQKDRISRLPVKRGSDLLQELGNPHLQPQQASPTSEDINLPQLVAESEFHKLPDVHIHTTSTGFSWLSGVVARRSQETSTESVASAFQSFKDTLLRNNILLQSVVLVYIYCQDLSEFSTINVAMATLFPQNPPARVCVGASLDQDVIFCMDCLIYQVSDAQEPLFQHTMHVQSISHWAPANIGPYSQSVQIGDTYYCAGILGLCPSTMTTIEGGIHSENVLCLRSVNRVLEAMDSSLQLKDIVFCLCFVTESSDISIAKQDFSEALKRTKFDSDAECETEETQAIICFAIVPRLPRSVAVEWHVISAKTNGTRLFEEKRLEFNETCLHVKYSWDKVSGQGFILIHAEMQKDMPSLKLQPLLVDIMEELRKVLNLISCSWEKVLCLRLFYPHSVIKFEAMFSAFRKSVDYDTSPAMTCIPVEGLEPGYILSLCVYLQDDRQSDPDT